MEIYINALNTENKKTHDLILQEHTALLQSLYILNQEKTSLTNDNVLINQEVETSRQEVETSRALIDKLYDDDLVKKLMKKNNKWYIMDDLEKKNYKNIIKELYAYLEK